MNCARCEIIRAKLRATILFNLACPLEEIVADLNERYSGFYLLEWSKERAEIRRVAVQGLADSVLIFSVKSEPWLNNPLNDWLTR